MANDETNFFGSNQIRKVLFNEVSFALALASAVFWFLSYINNPIKQIELDIALMKQNINVITEKHLEYNQNATLRDDKIVELDKKIERILTILERP